MEKQKLQPGPKPRIKRTGNKDNGCIYIYSLTVEDNAGAKLCYMYNLSKKCL